MALLKCPECGKDVSSEATSCPHCGFPLKKVETKIEVKAESKRTNIVVNRYDGFPFDADYVKKYKKSINIERLVLALFDLAIIGLFIFLFSQTAAYPQYLILEIVLFAIVLVISVAPLFTTKCRYRMAEGQAILLYYGVFKHVLIIDGVEVDRVGLYFFSHYLRGSLKSGHTLKVRMNDVKGITFLIDE